MRRSPAAWVLSIGDGRACVPRALLPDALGRRAAEPPAAARDLGSSAGVWMAFDQSMLTSLPSFALSTIAGTQ